jgi:hypothetical protein
VLSRGRQAGRQAGREGGREGGRQVDACVCVLSSHFSHHFKKIKEFTMLLRSTTGTGSTVLCPLVRESYGDELEHQPRAWRGAQDRMISTTGIFREALSGGSEGANLPAHSFPTSRAYFQVKATSR